jgi:S-DNA-T family DNA segregation ATPase FtsK/SpoIIIE
MANSLRKKTPPPPDPEKLTADKDVEVTVTEVVKDERTTKIAGAVSLLIAIFLFVAFTSYLFTWQEDQDKVLQFGIKIFAVDDVKVNNLLGVLGAFIAHNFIYKGFGIASYLFCTFFFVLGVNLLVGKKIFSLLRNFRYVLVGLIVISMALSFVTTGAEFSWGGAVGELLNSWFIKWIGYLGTGAMLMVAVFSYVIWRFNPSFKWPERKQPPVINAEDENKEFVLSEDEQKIYGEWDGMEEKIPKAEEVLPLSTNKLNNDGKLVTVIMPDEKQPAVDPLTEFGLTEKEEREERGKLFIDDSHITE